MRTFGLLLAIGLAACAPASNDAGERLPPVLHRLLLNEDSEEGTPITYGHLFHLDEKAMGREMKCVDCHHHLEADPEGVPLACSACHGPEDDTLEDARKKGKVPGI